MNNVNDQLLFELNRMEQVQLSGQIHGKPVSRSTLLKIRDFPKTSRSINDPLQQKEGKPTPSVRNLGERVANRDSEYIHLKNKILGKRQTHNMIDSLRDNAVTGGALNAGGHLLTSPLVPSIFNSVVTGVGKRLNNKYYSSGQFDKDHSDLQKIQHSRNTPGSEHYVDPKTRVAFSGAKSIALDKTGRQLKQAYSKIPRRTNADDFTKDRTLSGIARTVISQSKEPILDTLAKTHHFIDQKNKGAGRLISSVGKGISHGVESIIKLKDRANHPHDTTPSRLHQHLSNTAHFVDSAIGQTINTDSHLNKAVFDFVSGDKKNLKTSLSNVAHFFKKGENESSKDHAKRVGTYLATKGSMAVVPHFLHYIIN